LQDVTLVPYSAIIPRTKHPNTDGRPHALPSLAEKGSLMPDNLNEPFECRERIKSKLLAHGIDPNEYSDLVTDLMILVMNWPIARPERDE
jgi:hypothetical protein